MTFSRRAITLGGLSLLATTSGITASRAELGSFLGVGEGLEDFWLATDAYAELFRGLYDRGVYIAPSQYECLFPSLAHTDEVIDLTLDAISSFFEGRNR